MIGLDTNVVIRYLVQDEPGQAKRASEIIDALTEADQGFISLVTAVEVYWVLRRGYDLSTGDCMDVLEGLVEARELKIDCSEIVRVALTRSRQGADFADAVIAEVGRQAGCDYTLTFDRRAVQFAGMRLLE